MGKKSKLRAFSPFTFSLVFLSTEPASLVATHVKSPLWLADAARMTRAPSSPTEKSDCSGWISRPFLNQRIFGRGEPEFTRVNEWGKGEFRLTALGRQPHLRQEETHGGRFKNTARFITKHWGESHKFEERKCFNTHFKVRRG